MKSYTKQTIKIFWQACMKYPYRLAFLLVCAITATTSYTYVAVFQRDFIDAVSTGQSYDVVIGAVVKIYAALWTMWLLWRFAGFTNVYFQSAGKRDIYVKCFEYMHGHSSSFFNNNFVGSLVRRINKYDRAFEDITDQLFWSLIPTFASLILVLVILWNTNNIVAGIFTGGTIMYLVFSYFFARIRMKYDLAMNAMDSKATGFVADTITNHSNIKLFTTLGFELNSFKRLTDQWRGAMVKTWNIGVTQEAIQGFLMIGVDLVIILISVRLWSEGRLSVGEIVMIQVFMSRIFDKLWEIGRNIRRMYQGFADANEMTEILLTPHQIKDVAKPLPFKIKSGEVDFKNIDFGYNKGSLVLKNFNLKIKPKEKIGLVGPSGGGKTTVSKLLLRLMDVNDGEILIDGQNIAKVKQDDLRAAVSYVPQDPILFHRTLEENILYGRESATKKQVIEASKLSHAHEFIASLKDGYDTFVGERGVKLSGGERQRVALARAFLKNAPILVLDEATSALDSESEKLIQDALHKLLMDKTAIVIAHRLSTIMEMDRIIVIDQGKIVDQGKHEDLIKKDGLYAHLWNIQSGGFLA